MSPILLDLVADRSATFTATVIIAGAGIVFLMLVLLIIIFYLFGKVVSSAEAKGTKKGKTNKITKSEQKLPTPAPAKKASAPAPQVEAGISGEVVAAIAAAVAVSEGEGAVVKSIRRVNVVNVRGRNPWANAAVYDNTRPF